MNLNLLSPAIQEDRMTGVRTKRSTQVANSVVTYINIKRGDWITAVVLQYNEKVRLSLARSNRLLDRGRILAIKWPV